jgi:hypothetical protein
MQTINRKLIVTILLLPLAAALLAGCRAAPDRWQAWFNDLIGAESSPVPVPPAGGEAPALAPTPTLALGAFPTESPPLQATTPSATATSTGETGATQEAPPAESTPGAFSGTFTGTIEGYNDSSAPLDLQLEQRGRQIAGTASIGEGLVVSAGGVCGTFAIPATTLRARDELDQVDGRHLLTTTTVQVSGIEIPVELQATLGPDGQTVTAQATIYPPSLCGNTPTLNATLMRLGGDG